jgi:2-polyprenyl-6-methoxyphenol hydroxylase-like FAD-dependent oxidoreductase
VTGHGLTDAYRDAELLAVALHQALAGEAEESTALAGYQARRDEALRDVFDLTCALARYPAVPEFVDLQKRLAVAIDAGAAELAAWPAPGRPEFART